ncbi:MAG: ribonuclease HII [Longilinea sp.]|mgnify:CR=1 FL=1|nr:ribonuclease HII [Longilinea sp.]
MPHTPLFNVPPAPTLDFEAALWRTGLRAIAGLDEAGRGAWAGPVAAAAVILPPDCAAALAGVRDSKQMTARQRAEWAAIIRQKAIAWGVGMASVVEIDELGIVPATRLAMQRALDSLQHTAEHLLIDALRLPKVNTPQTALIKGDRRSLSIAAASVLAKTSRDALLCELEHAFPGYGFAQHKGYGTAAHRAALEHLGPCPQHRHSFHPIQSLKEMPCLHDPNLVL